MPLRVVLPPLPADSAPLLTPTGPHAHFAPFRLQSPISFVGNREGVHVRLRSRQISGTHAVLVCGRDRAFVRDLGSRTGTLVNGEPVAEAELFPGDSLRFGPLTCTFTRNVKPPAAERPPATITLVPGPGAKSIVWDGRVFLVGRRERADLFVPGDDVSTVHAVICQVDGRFYLRDAASRTGTFLNGAAVHQAEICIGDTIRVGSATLKCVGATGGPVRPASAAQAAEPDLEAEDLIDASPPPQWGPLAAAVGRARGAEPAGAPPPPPEPAGRLSQLWKKLRR